MRERNSVLVTVLVAGGMAAAGWVFFGRLSEKARVSRGEQAQLSAPQASPAAPATEGRREGIRLAMPAHAQVMPLELPVIGGAEKPDEAAAPGAPAANAAPETPFAPAADGQPAAPALGPVEQAKKLIGGGKKAEARALLTEAILASGEGPARDEMRSLLDQINAELFFSRSPSPDCSFYRVQKGDTLDRIIKSETKPRKDIYFADLIMRINGIANERRIRDGQNLKVPQGVFSAIVQKRAHRLIILFNGQYIKEYPVTLGAPATPTPAGAFLVDTKQKNPDWYAPDGGVYKFGDQRNILGTRWIGFQETEQFQSYGIHGTADPQSIGKDASNGCVRMLNADVEEVFSMLMTGDSVKIVE